MLRPATSAAIALLCLCIIAAAQTALDPRWFDDDPANDPDDPNYCFTIWDCTTSDHWTRGWHAWRRDNGLSYDAASLACVQVMIAPTSAPVGMRVTEQAPAVTEQCNPPLREPASDNLCDTVWTCQTQAEWVNGYTRLQQILNPPAQTAGQAAPAAPSPQAASGDDDDDRDDDDDDTNEPAPTATPMPTPTATEPPHDHEHLHEADFSEPSTEGQSSFVGLHSHAHEHSCDPLHAEHLHYHYDEDGNVESHPCPELAPATPTSTPTQLLHDTLHLHLHTRGVWIALGTPDPADYSKHSHPHGHNCGSHFEDAHNVHYPHYHGKPDSEVEVDGVLWHCHTNYFREPGEDVFTYYSYYNAYREDVNKGAHGDFAEPHDIHHDEWHQHLGLPTIEPTEAAEIIEEIVPNILCTLGLLNPPPDCPTATPTPSITTN